MTDIELAPSYLHTPVCSVLGRSKCFKLTPLTARNLVRFFTVWGVLKLQLTNTDRQTHLPEVALHVHAHAQGCTLFFQTARNRLKILCAKRMTWRNIHIEGSQILGAKVQNLCTPALTLATLSSSEKYWLEDKKPRWPFPSSFLPNSVWTNHTSQARAPAGIWTLDYLVCSLFGLITL